MDNLMLDTGIYSRQEAIGLLPVPEATVVGIGGIGTWVAILLAMSGVKRLHLMDSDKLELSNLNRLPFRMIDIARLKTVVVKLFISAIRRDCTVLTYPKAESFTLEMIDGTHLFDCTDRHDVQSMLHSWCEERKVTYIRIGYDGIHITVTSTVPDWIVGEEQEGYQIQASWVVPAIIAAALGVAKAMLDPYMEISEFINNLGGRRK